MEINKKMVLAELICPQMLDASEMEFERHVFLREHMAALVETFLTLTAADILAHDESLPGEPEESLAAFNGCASFWENLWDACFASPTLTFRDAKRLGRWILKTDKELMATDKLAPTGDNWIIPCTRFLKEIFELE